MNEEIKNKAKYINSRESFEQDSCEEKIRDKSASSIKT